VNLKNQWILTHREVISDKQESEDNRSKTSKKSTEGMRNTQRGKKKPTEK
jgi:hypothetical protein